MKNWWNFALHPLPDADPGIFKKGFFNLAREDIFSHNLALIDRDLDKLDHIFIILFYHKSNLEQEILRLILEVIRPNHGLSSLD